MMIVPKIGRGCAALVIAFMTPVAVASAQQEGGAPPRTSIGQVGQRQTRAETAPATEPLERIQNRIANRVQSRIRNRIDRFYDPQANAASPFAVAADQSRRTGQTSR